MPASALRVLSPSAVQGAGLHSLSAEAARSPSVAAQVPWPLLSGPADCACGRRDASSGGTIAAGERGRATARGRGRRAARVAAVLADPPQTSPAPKPLPAVPLSNADRRGGGNTAELGLTDSYQGGLASTWEHRAWVAAGSTALLAALAKGLSAVHGADDAALAAAALVAGYLLADLGTGVYHWGVDNYGDATTPIFGSQIDAFQGHHRRPWTITQRQFANNLYALCRPAAFFVAPFLLLPSSAPGHCFLAVFMTGVVFSQQFHAWAHMKKGQLPGVVLALQDAGVLVSRKAHGAHHRPPFEGNYSIVSGIWNKALDGSGVFKKAERFIFDKTGVAPRNWTEIGEEFEDLKYYEFSSSDSE
ncbi:fatty acid desaturase 4 [Klebsormidium nitens]|uniref:Fatty acid desaturase 4 n=1 Tax=Klebsormidium nitens TaxID=105231 RepID=A0A1Y1IRK1_KLENI|nr:fatty acid desaturase 4 [Klebsormidium nitens]|eukprot:GAQ91277.1 fatty acid desaturase 4 [Klebsormidium nitens]